MLIFGYYPFFWLRDGSGMWRDEVAYGT